MLMNDLAQLVAGVKTEHNLVYRWLDREKNPIWINCRARIILDEDNKPQFLVGCINEIGTKPLADNVSGLLESVAITVRTGLFFEWALTISRALMKNSELNMEIMCYVV